MRAWLFLLLFCPGWAFAAASNQAVTSRDTASLVSAANTPVHGRLLLGLRFQLQPGWHIYWSNPGDAGLAPTLTLDPPATAGAFTFPPPSLLRQSGVAAYVLSGDVLLPFTASNTGATITATAQWLVCRDICVPEHARFILPLAGGSSAEAGLFAPSAVVPSPFTATIAADGTLHLAGLTPAEVRTAHFFPAAAGAIINNQPQRLTFSLSGMALRLPLAPGFHPPLQGVLELTDPSGRQQALSIEANPGGDATTTLPVWLAFAFLGGLILNLMPCVFPILAMKAVNLARLGGAARGAVRRDALAYTAGVLVAMLALAALLIGLRAAGTAIGWGFQLQSPVFVAFMALLVLAIALNLAGFFFINLPRPLSGFAGHGSFLTGLLAVAVATPCTAPFMGGAIAAALVAPLPAAAGIFLCLGLGLAAPFLLIALLPGAARLLPRPGAWMITLQRLLSLPMFATALWLAWVFTTQLTPNPAPTIPGAESYSAARLATLRAAGQPVFVDITAAWCITCLVNERGTLQNASVKRQFTATHTQLLIGDWTTRAPAITTFLQANNRDGVPLYVYYGPHTAPVVLPQILTPEIVESEVK